MLPKELSPSASETLDLQEEVFAGGQDLLNFAGGQDLLNKGTGLVLEQELEIKQIILPILLFLTPTPSLDPLLHPKTFLQSVLKQEEQKDLPQDKTKGIPKPFSNKNCWVYLNSE